jgi:hypothetical protein
MPSYDPLPPRRLMPPHFPDPYLPPRGDDRFGPRGPYDDLRGPQPLATGPYERDDWPPRDPDPVRRSWPERYPPEPAWRDSPPPLGFRHPQLHRGSPHPGDDHPLERRPGFGTDRRRHPADYDRPLLEPAPRVAPAREVRLVSGRPRQAHVFAPEPLPQTSRQELLDPPTAGYNPYGRAVGEEEPAAQVPPPPRRRSVVAVCEVRAAIASSIHHLQPILACTKVL